MTRRSLTVLAATAALVIGASPAALAEPRAVDASTARVSGSVGQVHVVGAVPDAALTLVDRSGRIVTRGSVDGAGSLIFREVPPGSGYRVRDQNSNASPAVRVRRADDPPAPSFYRSQVLGSGYQYVTTRDKTLLAVNVRLPGPPEAGPYPTVIEYSGYDPASPESTEAASGLAAALGYATVGVNMRGTGCSGGAWEYFEPLQSTDGYDVVEIVAAQTWVAHGHVGMVGISYPGISQLFVAATRPPHLAAITPLSVIDDTYRGVLYPGGILNSGFALSWAKGRQADARPAPTGGQSWAKRRIAAGDQTCAANQAMRLQTRDLLEVIREQSYYAPATIGALAPARFVDDITVPTFLAGAWQDEQTGGHWAEMIDAFDPDVTLRVTASNGTHADSLGPEIITRWAEFLDFYVARRIPSLSESLRTKMSLQYARVAGSPLPIPADRFTVDENFDDALARYESEQPIRVLFDSGAGGDAPGLPYAGFEASFEKWPLPSQRVTTWFLASGARLTRQKPGDRGIDTYRYDPSVMPATSHPSDADDYFEALPAYDWRPVPTGAGLAYVTEPLDTDTVVLGSGSVDVWLRSSARDVDLEVTISEVRPDGQEMYVQSGWLRASHRALDEETSTRLEPVHSHTRADAAPLPRQRFTLVRVAVFPFGHAFRAESRIRLTIQAPGGNRPRWEFATVEADGEVVNEIARSSTRPSRVVLPVVDGVEVTSPLPACPSLRGQPCRAHAIPQEGA